MSKLMFFLTTGQPCTWNPEINVFYFRFALLFYPTRNPHKMVMSCSFNLLLVLKGNKTLYLEQWFSSFYMPQTAGHNPRASDSITLE